MFPKFLYWHEALRLISIFVIEMYFLFTGHVILGSIAYVISLYTLHEFAERRKEGR